MDYNAWLRKYSTPRVYRLTGECVGDESAEDEGPLADWSVLTQREWHAVEVERLYHERHACSDRGPIEDDGKPLTLCRFGGHGRWCEHP